MIKLGQGQSEQDLDPIPHWPLQNKAEVHLAISHVTMITRGSLAKKKDNVFA